MFYFAAFLFLIPEVDLATFKRRIDPRVEHPVLMRMIGWELGRDDLPLGGTNRMEMTAVSKNCIDTGGRLDGGHGVAENDLIVDLDGQSFRILRFDDSNGRRL